MASYHDIFIGAHQTQIDDDTAKYIGSVMAQKDPMVKFTDKSGRAWVVRRDAIDAMVGHRDS